MRCAVITFPGSNFEDYYYICKEVLGNATEYVFHKETFNSNEFDLIILPGGTTYGDYVRAGAIAVHSHVMESVVNAASMGKLIFGIGNGFQILLETRLLPGALTRNKDLKFHCHDVFLKVENETTPFTGLFKNKDIVKMPIAHGEGCYYADDKTLRQLKTKKQIVFRYCDSLGIVSDKSNPNGSIENIAGIVSENGNILGMMPHPERCSEEILGNTDGRMIFNSILHFSEGGINGVK
ncbi:MAG: phosphoribosylformylglycinamidine synthase subunit PurQ [Tepidanaerobacteraceae bacterium]|jgi:phosphoribosylformylglycinamidine synthase I